MTNPHLLYQKNTEAMIPKIPRYLQEDIEGFVIRPLLQPKTAIQRIFWIHRTG
jgi:hypothetical protein